ncbi:hypothetical protein [Akkermansia sp.]|jgi:hypothetical protein|uniref:hypothetical protein n=1 Tax=Akkermansia sp. TaxID=1872421 RepID=UPI0025C12707|nr:hypothetical protein [Akkermansia sp.]MCD8064478.1 hypothetical protein [Akkermansia sp.]
MKASLRILNPDNHTRYRKPPAYKKCPVHSSQANSAPGTTAFPDNFFFFIHSLLTPDSKSASGEKETGLPGMAYGFRPSEYGV